MTKFQHFATFVFFALLNTVSGMQAVESAGMPNEVFAFLGGASMIAAVESGGFEGEIVRSFNGTNLRFRCLAWEGDTVFEQRRDLNYPSLEAQLDKVEAGVVVMQFGEMESLRGEDGLVKFVAAYEELIDRVKGDSPRRVVLVGPLAAVAPSDAMQAHYDDARRRYAEAVREIGERKGLLFVDVVTEVEARARTAGNLLERRDEAMARTGRLLAQRMGGRLALGRNSEEDARWDGVRRLIQAKNRLWFNYWRPQNWAFLNGDRTAQPSSRDHLDPSKRWFPAEMEQYGPLIAAREREIDALVARLTRP